MALDVLNAVLRHRVPLDECFDRHPALAVLASRDRAFARNLATITVRRLGEIDAIINRCVIRPLPGTAWTARNLLRLGIAQLKFLQTPPHAAVDQTVALAGERRQRRFVPLINAVLRRVAAGDPTLTGLGDAARLNTPDWLWRSWTDAYGAETCRRIAASHLQQAPLDITLKQPDDALSVALGAIVLPTGTLRLASHGRVSELPGFAQGAWWVQDVAAALPARLFGNVQGARIIDLCAAPGGKTMQLAAAGAKVVAVDRSVSRIGRVRENLARCGLEAETVVADATSWQPEQLADAVLVDAPCSATGTIRRHPDVAWLRHPDDVAKLADLQARLLAAAVRMVRRNGLIVYCVCSLQVEEGRDQICRLLARTPEVVRFPISAGDVAGLAEIVSADGDLRTLPCHGASFGGMDGFFAARLRRL